MTTGGPFHDPRMRGFRSRASVEAVLALIGRRVGPLGPETVDLPGRAGRVLAGGGRRRGRGPGASTARRWTATRSGARRPSAPTPYNPLALRAASAGPGPGRACGVGVGPGEAVEIATGSPLPDGADTVVKVESTETDGRAVRVVRADPARPARRPSRRGRRGRDGRAAGRAGSSARRTSACSARSGVGTVAVVRRPEVAVIVTGDELLAAGRAAEGCRIADANSVMLAALVARDGGLARIVGPLADDRDAAPRRRSLDAPAGSDAVLISGGSSTGPEDHAPGARGRARRAGRPRRRAPPGEPDGPGLRRRASRSCSCRATRSVASAPTTSSPARSSGASAAGRAAGPIARSSCPWPASSPRSSAGSITRGCGSTAGGSSRWPSAAPRSCPAPPGPTASSSSRPTSKATPTGPSVTVWLYD